MPPSPLSLDQTVRRLRAQLDDRKIPSPRVLLLSATGIAAWPDHLQASTELPLAELDAVPEPWNSCVLHAGMLGETPAWLIEDLSGDPLEIEPDRAWVRALPIWLAAASGAVLCIHTSAGSALAGEGDAASPLSPGSFAVVRDHVNLSGGTPLLGLGGSRLGPLFPDQTRLHHLGLRRALLEHADRLGIPAHEAVAACTAGPALETPAERRMLGRLGAEVAVQSLAGPLISAAHAGLSVLAVVAVTDAGAVEVASLLEAAADAEPRLEQLLGSLFEEIHHAVVALEEKSA
jgi:purine nucleoside phosphorylase